MEPGALPDSYDWGLRVSKKRRGSSRSRRRVVPNHVLPTSTWVVSLRPRLAGFWTLSGSPERNQTNWPPNGSRTRSRYPGPSLLAEQSPYRHDAWSRGAAAARRLFHDWRRDISSTMAMMLTDVTAHSEMATFGSVEANVLRSLAPSRQSRCLSLQEHPPAVPWRLPFTTPERPCGHQTAFNLQRDLLQTGVEFFP